MLDPNIRLCDIDFLKKYSSDLCPNLTFANTPVTQLTVNEIHGHFPSWSVESLMTGLEMLSVGEVPLHRIYSPSEMAADPEKANTKLWPFPVSHRTDKPFIIVCAGGSYQCVCNIAEAFPIAARLNQLGYNVFALNYRVNVSPVIPKPLEDLSAAYNFIISHADEFNIINKNYIVCGFSAGGNLTCLWGTEKYGWKKYNIPRPKALFPIYPPLCGKLTGEGIPGEFALTMFGNENTIDLLEEYDVKNLITAQYPPCYAVHCADDSVVPVENSYHLKSSLDAFGIPCVAEIGEKGEHGFGDGQGSDVSGWIDRAAAFENSL